jgi:hypothetical protein
MQSTNILALHNEGVKLMRKGIYRDATVLLQKGLKQLLSIDKNSSNTRVEPHDVGAVRTFQLVLSNDLVQSIDLSKTGAAGFQEHHSFSLFVRAFVAPTRNAATALSSRVARDRMTAAFLYNMGLAHHLLGIKDTVDDLKHALNFYGIAMEVLGRNVNIDETKLMFLAISNNMGSIYSHNFERNKVRCCLNWMTVALKSLYLVTSDDTDLGEEYVHFQTNVLVSIFKQKTIASRAA